MAEVLETVVELVQDMLRRRKLAKMEKKTREELKKQGNASPDDQEQAK